MKQFLRYLGVLFVALWGKSLYSAAKSEELLTKIDELYRSNGSEGRIEMEVITPDWSRTLKMDMWTKGMQQTFITIREPLKEKGVSSLKKGAEMWNFFPKINKTIKVPPSMMMGAWMGSDFTNDDLVRNSSLIHDYTVVSEQNKENQIFIELKAKEQTVSLWGKILLVVDLANSLPVRQEYYDERGEKIRVLHFKDVRSFGFRTIPATMELEPLSKKGHKTIVRYVDAKFDIDVPDSTFSLTNLEKRR